ncbi:MAG: ElyC/SanA/YdcF family protein [Desulfotomaculaceae bacterium]
MFKNKKIIFILLLLILTAGVVGTDQYVRIKGSKYIVRPQDLPGAQAAIVLGAYVFTDGELCEMLADRIETAVELYKNDKVKKIIMSGDHGRKDYDEVNSMRIYAEKLGIPTADIFMDHAGFSTYDSMYRSKEIFQVDTAVIVTQAYHLPRAVYTARSLGLTAVGIEADKHIYAGAGYYSLRETPARIKAFLEVNSHAKPVFLGEVIPVSGDGRATHDGN